MVQYKLMYFSVRGRAEATRLIFAAAGVEYEDYRFKEGEWKTVKPTVPFGQVPVLLIDGKMYPQSASIARYLARKFGLVGSTPEEELECDAVVDQVKDVIYALMKMHFEKDEARKATLRTEFMDETIPNNMKKLEEFLKDSGYFVGNGLTWADIVFFNAVHDLLPMTKSEKPFLDGFPKLQSLMDNVAKQEGIAAWLAKRPQTNF